MGELDLSNQEIREIENGAFSDMISLLELNLEQNFIGTIYTDSFKGKEASHL